MRLKLTGLFSARLAQLLNLILINWAIETGDTSVLNNIQMQRAGTIAREDLGL
jgi:hypothetical protein